VGEKSLLFNTFKELRERLSGDNTGLELKTSGKGVISWTTRGQFGLGSEIKATTGFQRKGMSKSNLFELFNDTMGTSEKQLEYIQTSLRSATDISKKGGHVVQTYRDSAFTMKYDNRRLIIDNIFAGNDSVVYQTKSKENLSELLLSPYYKECVLQENTALQENSTLLDSRPLKNVEECENLRYISKRSRIKVYNSKTSFPLETTLIKSGKNYKGLVIRHFIKSIFSDRKEFVNMKTKFKNYNELVSFIKGFDIEIKITKQSISNLLNRKIIQKQIPRNEDTLAFITYVKTKFPEFNDKEFFAS